MDDPLHATPEVAKKTIHTSVKNQFSTLPNGKTVQFFVHMECKNQEQNSIMKCNFILHVNYPSKRQDPKKFVSAKKHPAI